MAARTEWSGSSGARRSRSVERIRQKARTATNPIAMPPMIPITHCASSSIRHPADVQESRSLRLNPARKLHFRSSMKSWLRGWKLWAVVALVVTGFLLMLAQDQDTIRVQSPVAATDTGFPEYLASLVGASVLRSDTYTVLRNGDQVFPAMLDAIKQAR